MKQGSLSKWLILLVPVLLAVWQLYPTYMFRTLKAEREEIVAESGKDSEALKQWEEANADDLAYYKSKALKFGLDLEGGMYVTMEVDLVKMIEQNADRDAVDEVFSQVIEATKADVAETNRDAVEVFIEKFNEIAVPQQRELFDYFQFGDLDLVEEAQIAEKLSSTSDEAIEQAMQILGQRINKYAVSETSISQQGTDRIVIEIPGVTNEAEVRQLLDKPANLSFNLVRNNADVVNAFYDIDQLLKQFGETDSPSEPQVEEVTGEEPLADDVEAGADETVELATEVEVTDSATVDGEVAVSNDTNVVDTNVATNDDGSPENPYEGLSDEEARAKFSADFPFTSMFSSYFISPQTGGYEQIGYSQRQFPPGAYYFQIHGDSLAKFRELIARPEIRNLIPPEYDIVLSANPDQRILRDQNVEIYEIWSVKAEPELTGDVVVDAMQSWDEMGNPEVAMTMDSEGAERWGKITQANVGKRVAIVLDSAVYSAPNVNEPIFGGRSSISGSGDRSEAKILAIILKAGALKAPIEIVQERVVGPSLGEDSIAAGVNASLAALILVLVFMLIYYAMAGAVANLAVFFNLLLILTLLAGFNGTLTLPGIAGLILTIGMAVDANILIFERIREELAAGRALRSAVDEGYGKALSAILDSNITTFITGVILFYMGSGPIQGFAVTLMIGIAMTLFTAIVVTRAVIELFLLRGANSFNFGQPKIAAS